jgi:hypothetical protein
MSIQSEASEGLEEREGIAGRGHTMQFPGRIAKAGFLGRAAEKAEWRDGLALRLRVLTFESMKKKRRKRPSLFDRLKDLVGKGDSGITDLATNPKHMEGFGKHRR